MAPRDGQEPVEAYGIARTVSRLESLGSLPLRAVVFVSSESASSRPHDILRNLLTAAERDLVRKDLHDNPLEELFAESRDLARQWQALALYHRPSLGPL